MAQNIYDDDEFFAGYSRLARSVEGLDGAPEWPALRAMLPDLRGLRVLDLGCGFGWFCRWARRNGAANVVGIDLSEKMLERAPDKLPGIPPLYSRPLRTMFRCTDRANTSLIGFAAPGGNRMIRYESFDSLHAADCSTATE